MNITSPITIPLTAKLSVWIGHASKFIGLLSGTASFNPASLFTGGILGYAYDPSDYSKTWQDSARTTPVTAVSDPIGCIDDISGNGANRTQATSGKRPLAATSGYYDFDGIDDEMGSTVSTVGGGVWTHIVRMQTDSDAVFVSIYGGDRNASYFGVVQSGSGSTTNSPTGSPTLTTLEVGGSAVTNTRGSLYTALNSGNKTMYTETASLPSVYWASTFYVGAYGGFTYSGKYGREILINRALTAAEKPNAIAWVEGF